MGTNGGTQGVVTRFRRTTKAKRTLVQGGALALLVMVLTACPGLPPPEVLDFESDPRILRGTWTGSVDLREEPSHIALAGDASVVATAWQSTVEVTDLSTSALLTTIQAGTQPDSRLADLSIDGTGKRVAGIVHGVVRVWSVPDGASVSEFDPSYGFGGCVHCSAEVVSLDPAGALFAVASGTSQVLVVNAESGEVTRTLTAAGEQVKYVAFSGDGTRLAVGSVAYVDDTYTAYYLTVWSMPSFEKLFEAAGGFQYAYTVQFEFSADGMTFAAGTDLATELHDLAAEPTVPRRTGPFEAHLLALSPDGNHGVFVRWIDYSSSQVEVVHLNTGAVITSFERGEIDRAAWSTNGALLNVGSALYTASDFQPTDDLSKGLLHGLELVSSADYVDAGSYRVTGVLTVDGGPPIDVEGVVSGRETQRYLTPQARLPMPAMLQLDVAELGWSLRAYQHLGQNVGDASFLPAWNGYMTYLDLDEWQPLWPFTLVRADL